MFHICKYIEKYGKKEKKIKCVFWDLLKYLIMSRKLRNGSFKQGFFFVKEYVYRTSHSKIYYNINENKNICFVFIRLSKFCIYFDLNSGNPTALTFVYAILKLITIIFSFYNLLPGLQNRIFMKIRLLELSRNN